MDNIWIARALEDVGNLLAIKGANPFRVRAYANAARTVREHKHSISEMVSNQADLTLLPGIGNDIARHIETLETQGETLLFREVAIDVPVSLLEITRLPGLGAKKVKALWQDLHIETIDDLDLAARAGRVAALQGFGEKTERKIVKSIREYRDRLESNTLGEADAAVVPFLTRLRGHPDVVAAEVVGEYRRRQEVVSGLTVVVSCHVPTTVVESCSTFPDVLGVEEPGDSGCTVVLRGGVRLSIRFVEAESFGTTLLYLTGSDGHVARLTGRANDLGIEFTEAGLYPMREVADVENSLPTRRTESSDEARTYAAMGLPWIPPELREDRGEIEAAERGELPRLIQIEDMRGDLHMHSTWSDGRSSLEEMLLGCAERGYEYFAITDHSRALAMAGGLDAEKLRKQWDELDEVASRNPQIRVLRSMEVDILGDGELDLEDDMLQQLDLVLVAVHSRFNLSETEQTARVTRALQHPEVNILVHPTGRLLNRRGPIALDLDAVMSAAAEFGVALELNSHPDRLDLSDVNLMRAREYGLKIVISTDAHRAADLALMSYGVSQARRAWLEKDDVLNSYSCEEMLATMKALKE